MWMGSYRIIKLEIFYSNTTAEAKQTSTSNIWINRYKSLFDEDKTDMIKAEILGANRFETYTKTRGASRAVIVRDGMILLIYETGSDLWIVPGGGIEKDETPEKCCVREAEEETGNLVLPVQEFTTLFEYYEEYCYITHYFICEVTGSGRMHLTEAAVHRGVEPKWIPLPEAVEIFSHHQSYEDVREEKRGILLYIDFYYAVVTAAHNSFGHLDSDFFG